MVVLSTILFPKEAKRLEINEALSESREDNIAGRMRMYETVMADIRKKLRAWK